MMDTVEFLVIMVEKQLVFWMMMEEMEGLILKVMMESSVMVVKWLVILVMMEVMLVLI